jgi:prevent-host-death family protein
MTINLNIKFNIPVKEGPMEKITVLDFRRHAEAVIRKVRQGKRLILTYRGQPVMRLEPIQEPNPVADDPFYALPQLATPKGRSLTNEAIDQIVSDTTYPTHP